MLLINHEERFSGIPFTFTKLSRKGYLTLVTATRDRDHFTNCNHKELNVNGVENRKNYTIALLETLLGYAGNDLGQIHRRNPEKINEPCVLRPRLDKPMFARL